MSKVYPLPPKNGYEMLVERFHAAQPRPRAQDGELNPDFLVYQESKASGHSMYPNKPFTREMR